jgi:tRNA threonylcarbamoyladenosine biosynthesis protein TsaB
VCSVAIHEQGISLASKHEYTPQSTASQLAVMIDDCLKQVNRSPKELKAIAVSAGPGSYTGLRIGVATAKGLCFGLGAPLIAVNSLDLLAAQIQPGNVEKAWLCPMFDARRMEVYTRLYDENLVPQDVIEAKVIDELSFASELEDHKIVFFGSGADKCVGVLKHHNVRIISGVSPSAEKMGELAYSKFLNNEFEDVETYEPFYLKDFLVKKPKTLF